MSVSLAARGSHVHALRSGALRTNENGRPDPRSDRPLTQRDASASQNALVLSFVDMR
jgi:hypothetical protein